MKIVIKKNLLSPDKTLPAAWTNLKRDLDNPEEVNWVRLKMIAEKLRELAYIYRMSEMKMKELES